MMAFSVRAARAVAKVPPPCASLKARCYSSSSVFGDYDDLDAQPWKSLIRFQTFSGEIKVGEPTGEVDAKGVPKAARMLSGCMYSSRTRVTNETILVKKLLSPVAPNTILCAGLNYHRHAEETKAKIPTTPIIFAKTMNSLNNPFDPIVIPQTSAPPEVDYEIELAAVIRYPCRNVAPEVALEYVLGYTIANDVSHRAHQRAQWTWSKSFDSFLPLGPVLVHASQIPDPQKLSLTTKLNGQVMQSSSTSDMLFSVAQLVSHLSQGHTLQPGDVILTGTPEGVGFVRSPPVFLKDGDEVRMTISSIGELVNRVTKNH